MMVQYLEKEGLVSTMMTLQVLQPLPAAPTMMLVQDEAAVKAGEQQARRSQLRRAKKLIMEGQWEEVDGTVGSFAA